MGPLLSLVLFGVLTQASGAGRPTFDVKELADYRLTAAEFKKFATASRLIADVIDADSQFAESPLFTKEISLSGDAPAMASALEARLREHLSLAQALHTAAITAHEYARFALALLAARLAHGFIDSGVLRRIPEGVATDNVIFVEKHYTEIGGLLKALHIEH